MVVIPEADFLFSYGYGSDMELLAGSLGQKIAYKMSCLALSGEMVQFKQEWMKGVTKIDYAPP